MGTKEKFQPELEKLETVNETVNETSSSQFDDLDYLRTTLPIFPEETTSAKCKLDREPKVREGIDQIVSNDDSAPEIFMILAKWWENKEARKHLKRMLDEEAEAKGIDPTEYMQKTLREFVDKYDGLADAVDRMKYIITYFKPRKNAKVKETYKPTMIDGVMYNVSLRLLSELRERYGDDKKRLREELKKNSEVLDVESLDL